MTIYAIYDSAAKDSFSAKNYAALENGDPHTLSAHDIAVSCETFETVEEASAWLRENGGGWYFDDEFNSYWVSDTDSARIERAAEHIGAVALDDGLYAYYAEETSSYWVVEPHELAELCDYLDDEDEQISSNAYSHWCAGTSSAREMPRGWSPDNDNDDAAEDLNGMYVIECASGVEWLIESAESEEDALAQYYDGDAEPHRGIRAPRDAEEVQYLRDEGQAS